RHTRSKRDWSSDVCSSDLWYPGYLVQPVTQFINATFFQYGIAAYDLELGKNWATRHDNPEWMAEAKKVVNKIKKQAGKDYLLFQIGRASCRERDKWWAGQ